MRSRSIRPADGMDFGAWGGRSLAGCCAREPGAEAASARAASASISARPAARRRRQVQARLQPLLTEIAAAGVPTVIVAHKAVLRALLALATGWEMLGKPPVKLKPDSAHLFRLDESGRRFRVERMNVSLLPQNAVPQ